jgi:putative transposase
MRDSHRRLPHQHPDGKWFFVTWHLHGSLPHALYPPREKLTSGTAFACMDRYLDTTRLGPMYLAQESLAGIVVASLHRGTLLGHYELGAYVVMSNHVHVLLLPRISPSRLLQSLKGATAREANRALGRTGETFIWSSAGERSAETSLGAPDTSVRATFADRVPPKM